MYNPQPSRLSQFKRPRVLIVGCGDVGLRVAKLMLRHGRVRALTSQTDRVVPLRQQGIVPLVGNLDQPASLARLAGLAQYVVHMAPPPSLGAEDTRTAHVLAALGRRGGGVRALVYGSTTGVYGDAQGARFDETRPLAPATDRARRRVDAESRVRWFGRQHIHRSGTRVSILRIPGIYAADREGGHPRDRVAKGSPVLVEADDVYTNHIHADDLARIAVMALWRGKPGRVLHACDHTEMRMGDYFDWVADHHGLARPPRVTRQEAAQTLSAMQMSFWSESRRLINQRLTEDLRLRLRYPTVKEGLKQA